MILQHVQPARRGAHSQPLETWSELMRVRTLNLASVPDNMDCERKGKDLNYWSAKANVLGALSSCDLLKKPD